MKAVPKTSSTRGAKGKQKPLKAGPRAENSIIQANESFVSIEWLAQRWLCAPKTARQKVQAHGLGIRPAGKWLISKSMVEAYEASLLCKPVDISDDLVVVDQASTINENLKKFRVIENAELKRRLFKLAPPISRKVE